jgi:hypothetical protein
MSYWTELSTIGPCFPFCINSNSLFLNRFYKKSKTSFVILISFSRVILLNVAESLQDTFGNIGVPKYSPTKASMCFLINGINSTDVGFPIP